MYAEICARTYRCLSRLPLLPQLLEIKSRGGRIATLESTERNRIIEDWTNETPPAVLSSSNLCTHASPATEIYYDLSANDRHMAKK